MIAWLLRGLARGLAILPLRWIHALARPLGVLLASVPWAKHAVVRRNLAACFPERNAGEQQQLQQAQGVELLRLAGELGALAYWSPKRLDGHIEIVEGWPVVEQAVAEGRGLLLVSGHLGNWEILNLELSRRLSMVTLYLAPKNAAVDRFITQVRERFGGRMVPSGSVAMRELLRQLKNGGAVGIAADIQPKQGDGVFVPFFGVPALTMSLVNRLARRTNCAVVFCRAERRSRGLGWRLYFQGASDQIAGDDPAVALAEMNHWLADSIRRRPAQYLWIYKRFSRRPEGEPRFYPKR
ncbi:MAG: lysophospholipid acyltransferase family protein [Wenzhouxiangella sp.]